MKEMKRTVEKADLFFGALFILGAFVYLSKLHLGIPSIDESFYLTVPYRLAQGDSLLVDEWHVSQMVGFLMYPIMKLYLLAAGGTEGIYLNFRYIYLLLQSGVTVISYILLRKRDQIAAALSCIVFYMFTVCCINALSYNTIGLMAVWLFVAVALTETVFFRTKHVILGMLLASAILCNPYMLLMYIICTFGCIRKKKSKNFFGIGEWIWITVGAGIMLGMFLLFLLSRVTLAEIAANIPYIFWDPAHESKSFLDFIRPVLWLVNWFKPFFIFFTGGMLLALFCPKLRKLSYIGLILLSIALCMVLAIFKTSGIGKHAIMLPLTLLGGTAFMLTKEKSWDLFSKGWMTGIIYAVCMNFSSNQGIYVICNACTISSCVSLFFIKDFFEENQEWVKRWYWFAALAFVQLTAEVYVNLNFIYEEEKNSLLSYEIENGPFKGIYTTEEKKKEYDINYENIRSFGNVTDKNIVFFNSFPCGYLIAEKAKNGTFSAWQAEYQRLDDERMTIYDRLHPDKKPDIIYIDTRTVLDWPEEEWAEWCRQYGYVKENFTEGGIALFLDYNGLERKETRGL